MMKLLFVVSLLVSVAFGHLCLISPPQRGSMMNLNTAASKDCGLQTGPCGGRMAQDPDLMLVKGTNFTITWQKNENHWTAANPGTMTVSWADAATPTMFMDLSTFTDTNAPTFTLYSYNLMVPSTLPKQIILRVTYDAPALPSTFYQCADVLTM